MDNLYDFWFLSLDLCKCIRVPQQIDPLHCTVGQSPKGMMVFIYIGHLSGLQGVEMCAGLLQSVPMGAAECVQGYRVCAGCSFNILPCSSRLNQKIFY